MEPRERARRPAAGGAGRASRGIVPAVLEVEDLRAEFRLQRAVVRAVEGVSFQVRAGECVGIVGESGCGKSTTGLSVMRLLPSVGHISGGSVRLLGRDLLPLAEREMRAVRGNEIAMVFQDPMTALDPTMTIGRQIAEPVRLHRGASRSQAMARALEVLHLVGVPRPEERLGAYPHQLSGGLRQRVMIAMALACEPSLLVADEPTTALDVTIQAQILDLIDELRDRLDMGVVLVTHDMGVIAARTDRVLVMYAAKIVEAAATDELFSSMHHPYTEALLESIPRLDQDRSRRLASIPGIPPDLSRPLAGCRFSPRCRYATDACRTTEPTLTAVGPVGAGKVHAFACFHPLGAPGGPRPVAVERSEAAALAGAPGLLEGAAATPGPAEDGAAAVLSVEGLVKEYPVGRSLLGRAGHGGGRRSVKAVSGVTFEVRRGRTFGLVGESGCGKSTIGRLAVALEAPTAGRVAFEGADLSTLRGRELRRRRRDLQLMFQDPYSSLDPRMRVGSIVREPLAIQGVGSAAARRRRVRELLAEVGLPAAAEERYPHEFSGGQRQRIGLARALALNPRLIVADEPVSALDVSIQAQILNLMRRLQEDHGLTYVVISHDLAVVRYLADTIGVMYLGKLVEIGPAEDVYDRPAHPYTRGLLEAIPGLGPGRARDRRTAIAGELPSTLDPPSGCRFRTRCPFAEERCAREEPTPRTFGPRHRAACHFPLQPPVADEVVGTAAAP